MKGKPFETTIGVGQVIKGWDEGVPQMSLGERAKLTITPYEPHSSVLMIAIMDTERVDIPLLSLLRRL